MRAGVVVFIASTAALTAVAGCSTDISGNVVPATTSTSEPTTVSTITSSTVASDKPITAADLCQLMTPADFPVQGHQPDPPHVDGDPYFPSCGYSLVTGDGSGRTGIAVSLTFFPNKKLEPDDFEGRREITVAGRRAALGRGQLKGGDQAMCNLTFESARGRWFITVVDDTAPSKDGCVAAQSIGEKVAARVP